MTVYYQDEQVTLHLGDALEVAQGMEDGSVDCIVTSPPYFGLRDYCTEGQYGLEASPAEYVERMRGLFNELRRVLADEGTCWINVGDTYGPDKSLLGIPWQIASGLREDGWIVRNALTWVKTNAMPEPVTDRLSNRYEMVFMLSRQRRYWFDLEPIREEHLSKAPKQYASAGKWVKSTDFNHNRSGYVGRTESGKNPGDVWEFATQPFSAAHFAVFPVALPTRCILAGCKPGGTVLDPFSGSGTTGLAAQRTGRKYVGIDLNREYLDLSLRTRLQQSALDFEEPA